MVKRTSLDDATCPIARTLDVIGDWWSLLIVRDAMLGKRRFGEFQKSLGVAKNILAARLKTLVEQEILEIVPAADGSAYHDYVLTERGRSLYLVVSALRQWGEENMFGPGESCPVLVDAKNGKPVRKLELHAADGRVLGPGDTRLR